MNIYKIQHNYLCTSKLQNIYKIFVLKTTKYLRENKFCCIFAAISKFNV